VQVEVEVVIIIRMEQTQEVLPEVEAQVPCLRPLQLDKTPTVVVVEELVMLHILVVLVVQES
jgi:hypothetical protein